MRGPLDEIIRRNLYGNADNRQDGIFYFKSPRFINHYIRLDVSQNDWDKICLIDAVIENFNYKRYKAFYTHSYKICERIIVPFIWGNNVNWNIINDLMLKDILDKTARKVFFE